MLTGEEWAIFSEAARFIVKKLLLYDPLSRYSALQLFNHDWTQGKKGKKLKILQIALQFVIASLNYFLC